MCLSPEAIGILTVRNFRMKMPLELQITSKKEPYCGTVVYSNLFTFRNAGNHQ